MSSAIVMHTIGGPEVLRLESVEVPAPRSHEVLLRHTAIGVNYHDAYVRSGLYRTLPLPGIPGLEAVGVVEAIGTAVTDFQCGDRVAYLTKGYGAYAEQRTIDASALVSVPKNISDDVAASLLLKGLTAQVLVESVYAVRANDWVLVHAAAGGVGSLLCQWASHLGANVIGTVGSQQKVDVAIAAGCSHVILYREEDFVNSVRQITGGEGVQVAYDAVGKDTFFGSLECLAPCGHLANFGQASGPPLSRCSRPLEHPVSGDMRSSGLAVHIAFAVLDLRPALARGNLFGRDAASQTQQPVEQDIGIIVFTDAGPVLWRQRNGQPLVAALDVLRKVVSGNFQRGVACAVCLLHHALQQRQNVVGQHRHCEAQQGRSRVAKALDLAVQH